MSGKKWWIKTLVPFGSPVLHKHSSPKKYGNLYKSIPFTFHKMSMICLYMFIYNLIEPPLNPINIYKHMVEAPLSPRVLTPRIQPHQANGVGGWGSFQDTAWRLSSEKLQISAANISKIWDLFIQIGACWIFGENRDSWKHQNIKQQASTLPSVPKFIEGLMCSLGSDINM